MAKTTAVHPGVLGARWSVWRTGGWPTANRPVEGIAFRRPAAPAHSVACGSRIKRKEQIKLRSLT